MYNHQQRPKRLKRGLLALSFMMGLGGIGAAGLFIYNDLRLNQSPVVEGESRVVGQVMGSADAYFVNEPLFDFELPVDWREIDRSDTARERSITWQATKLNEDNRYLKLYINTIPDDPIVRLLPVRVNGSQLQRGQLSASCSTFSDDASAKWEDVEFRCDTARRVDTNIVGTGEAGQPINTFEITGPEGGTNRYFFVYTDRNISPNFEIFYSAINSFQAK